MVIQTLVPKLKRINYSNTYKYKTVKPNINANTNTSTYTKVYLSMNMLNVRNTCNAN